MKNKYTEDKDIHLMDMIYHIFENWRIFAIAAVIGLALGCGYKYYSNIKYNELLEINKNQEKADDENYLKNLTNTEKDTVIVTAQMYYQVKQFEQYKYESIYYNLSPYNVNMVNFFYTVDTGYTYNYAEANKPDYAVKLVKSYVNHIQNVDTLNDLSIDISQSDLNELISSFEGVNSNADAYESEDSNSFSVIVMGEDADQANSIAEALISDIDNYAKMLNAKIGSHKLTLVSKQSVSTKNDDLLQTQNDLTTKINTLQKNIRTNVSVFSEQQTAAYKLLTSQIDESFTAQSEEFEENVTDENTEELSYVALTDGMVKYALLGLFVGVFLTFTGVVLAYIIDDKVKYAEEVSDLWMLYLYGDFEYLSDDKKRRNGPIDRWIYSWKNREKKTFNEEEELTLMNIEISCKKARIDSLVLASSIHFDSADAEIVDKWAVKLTGLGINTKVCENLNRNIHSLEELAAVGNVVIVEKAGVSRLTNIDRTLQICKEQKATLMGLIVL